MDIGAYTNIAILGRKEQERSSWKMGTDTGSSAWNVEGGHSQQLTGKCRGLSRLPEKVPADRLRLWQPGRCGEASVNPSSALRFHATTFGEWWSQLFFRFQIYMVFFHWQTLSWTTQGMGYWQVSLFSSSAPIVENRGALGGVMPSKDPPSHTCCSILPEHHSPHTYTLSPLVQPSWKTQPIVSV